MFMQEKFLVKPDRTIYMAGEANKVTGYATYSDYNYCRPGLIPRIKRARFERALQLTSRYFGTCDAIDFGCADGFFLPSLAKYFNRVVGVDPDERSLDVAQKLIDSLNLTSVSLIGNRNLSFNEIKERMPKGDYKVAYLLETLEHIGTPQGKDKSVYDEKIDFLKELFTLLSDDGIIVISVPKMVGVPFFMKYSTQILLRLPTERIPIKEVFKSTVQRNTDNLEPQWNGGHVGFNHLKLEKKIYEQFLVEKQKDLFATAVYVIRRK